MAGLGAQLIFKRKFSHFFNMKHRKFVMKTYSICVKLQNLSYPQEKVDANSFEINKDRFLCANYHLPMQISPRFITSGVSCLGIFSSNWPNLLLNATPQFTIPVRCKSRKRPQSRKGQVDDGDDGLDDSSDSDDDDDAEDGFPHFDEDDNLPNNYKEVKKHVKSMRLDSVVSSAINIARNKVDEYFLGSKLRLNKERVLKKSKQVSEGDSIDLISEVTEDGKLKLKRIRITKISKDTTSKGSLIVYFRTWKSNVVVDNYDKR